MDAIVVVDVSFSLLRIPSSTSHPVIVVHAISGESCQQKVRIESNVQRFKTHYVAEPVTLFHIWHDLETTGITRKEDLHLKYFLLAFNFLHCYDTDGELSGPFQCCERTVRKWKWFHVEKLATLKALKASKHR